MNEYGSDSGDGAWGRPPVPPDTGHGIGEGSQAEPSGTPVAPADGYPTPPYNTMPPVPPTPPSPSPPLGQTWPSTEAPPPAAGEPRPVAPSPKAKGHKRRRILVAIGISVAVAIIAVAAIVALTLRDGGDDEATGNGDGDTTAATTTPESRSDNGTGPAGEKYPSEVRDNFLAACESSSGGKTAYCECALEAIEGAFTFAEFEDLERERIRTGETPAALQTVLQPCLDLVTTTGPAEQP